MGYFRFIFVLNENSSNTSTLPPHYLIHLRAAKTHSNVAASCLQDIRVSLGERQSCLKVSVPSYTGSENLALNLVIYQ